MTLLVQLISLQQERFSKVQMDMLNHLKLHQNMAYLCLFVGGLWSLQNLFLQRVFCHILESCGLASVLPFFWV